MVQQATSSTPAAVDTTPPSTVVEAATTPPLTAAEVATTDNSNPPWAEEDIIESEQASPSLERDAAFSLFPLTRLWSSLLCARRAKGTTATANAHRKALFARSTLSTSPSSSHSLPITTATTFDKWQDLNYALDAHGFYS